MATPETGKQRAARIPLDYHVHPNRLEKRKTCLWLAALVVSVLWWASGWLCADRGRLRYSRGPVADVHATWNARCDACHVPFHPIAGGICASWIMRTTGAGDQKCKNCHAGPDHNSVMSTADTPSCAVCHREHRGREASLVRAPDQLCTRCHENLTAHLMDKPPRDVGFANHVTRFDRSHHPDFRMLRATAKEADLVQPVMDPGNLTFNHKLHLSPGLVVVDNGKPAKPLRLSDIRDEADRDRYRGKERDDNVPVQLTCGSCHQLDGSDFKLPESRRTAAGAVVTRNSGGDMLPIRYENQCRACHPLTFDSEVPLWADPDQPDGQPKLVAVPHGLQPDAVRRLLERNYAAQFLGKNPQIEQQRLIPGARSAEDEQTVRQFIDEKIRTAQKILYAGKTTCGECHSYQIDPDKGAPRQIDLPGVPEIWFQHAKFDHAAHRALDCRECHEGADRSEDNKGEARPVLIPTLKTCEQCHSPPSTTGGTLHGGARFDCTECHLYHNRDKPDQWLTGVGSHSRDASTKFDPASFLRGIPSGPEGKSPQKP